MSYQEHFEQIVKDQLERVEGSDVEVDTPLLQLVRLRSHTPDFHMTSFSALLERDQTRG